MAHTSTYLFLLFALWAVALAETDDGDTMNALDEPDRVDLMSAGTAKKSSSPDLMKVVTKAMKAFNIPRKDTSEFIARMLSRTLSSFQFPGDLTLPSNIVVMVGAVVIGVIGIALIASLLMPFFGTKMCSILGTCDHYPYSYTNTGNYDAYAATGTFNQPNVAYTSGSGYQRSLEYMGPVLETLASAYEKYSSQQPLKKEKQK